MRYVNVYIARENVYTAYLGRVSLKSVSAIVSEFLFRIKCNMYRHVAYLHH
jgi:hypothetical protein